MRRRLTCCIWLRCTRYQGALETLQQFTAVSRAPSLLSAYVALGYKRTAFCFKPPADAAPTPERAITRSLKLPQTQGDVMKRYETEGLATCVLCIAGYGQLDALRDLCVAELVRTISPSTCVQLLHEAVLRSATDPTRYWAWLKEAAMATFRSALATTRSRTESPRVSFHDSPGSSPRPQEGAESFCAATFASLDPLVVMELLHTREILAASDETRTLLIAQCLQPWGLRHFGTATPWEVRACTTRGIVSRLSPVHVCGKGELWRRGDGRLVTLVA